MGCLNSWPGRRRALGDQVSGQDQQGEDEHLVEAVHVLQLLDHGGENHGPGPGDENEGADGDHGIDEVVAEHLDETGQSVGGDHRRMVWSQLSPMSMAVVSQPAFILDREFFIIR